MAAGCRRLKAVTSATPDAIAKLMSLTEAEFRQPLARLGTPEEISPLQFCFAIGSGVVTISFEPVRGVRLGGLLELPRACVRLAFDGMTAIEKSEFLRAFELTFQRGGG